MSERIVFCCGTSFWTRIIGWFLSVSNTACALTLITCIILLPYNDILLFAEKAASFFYGVSFEHMNTKPKYALVNFCFIVLLVNSPICAICSFLLLIGSYKRKSIIMVPWVIYMVMGSMVQVILEIIISISSNTEGVLTVLINIAFTLSYSTFCIWVVATHIKETEMSRQPSRPERGEVYKETTESTGI
ncbi:unnamed protein product [Allacma fusca]|uniref:Uncharacterized protein n=1 Tax=Allacma fusca TaxID=39272 RepID=A0A8J2P2R1_9HEXA|nr:unnamed protein product [Allacma fusca]